MRERTATFGSHGGLFGIIGEPDRSTGSSVTAVLLFNVGLNHHIGPHRLNVDLARDLAARGYTTLRFDLSGLGDSEPRRDTRSEEQRATLDVLEAMDFLGQRKGVQSFVVVGLCSGVDPAHAVAVADSRVKGAIFIDGYAYTTRGYYVRAAVERATRLVGASNYARWFRRRVLPLVRNRSLPRPASPAIFDRTFPPVEQFKADLRTMLGRGVQMLFLYTRHAYFFNHQAQFAEMIGEPCVPQGVDVVHQLGADHVFTSCLERERCVGLIGDWIDAHLAVGAGALEAAS